eukprot:scaffold3870_cov160-Skeletonema_menzelii.AAC.4
MSAYCIIGCHIIAATRSRYDNQGGFGSQGTPSNQTKTRRNYDEQTLIPVTIKQIITADGDPTGGNDISLKDGRTLYMVKIVGCVRSFEQKSTNLAIDIEDGTGMIEAKTWMNEGDECSAVANMRQECCQDYAFVRVIGQVKEFDGKRHIQATDIRLLGTKNEFTYHLLEVAYSFDKYQKRKESGGVGMGVGMGYGIGNMSSMPKTMGAKVSMNQGGGNSAADAAVASIKSYGETDTGVDIQNVIADLASQGFSEQEVRNAMENLANEGHVVRYTSQKHHKRIPPFFLLCWGMGRASKHLKRSNAIIRSLQGRHPMERGLQCLCSDRSHYDTHDIRSPVTSAIQRMSLFLVTVPNRYSSRDSPYYPKVGTVPGIVGTVPNRYSSRDSPYLLSQCRDSPYYPRDSPLSTG